MLELLYTALLYLIQPLIWIRLWVRGRKAPAYRKRWGERYGFYRRPLKPGGIMLHSVSVGETLAAIPLVRALRHRYPDLPITVTTMTPTGSERVQSAFGNDVQHVYLPYDLPDALNRFLNKIDPKLVLIMETELWPNLIAALHKRHIPLVIANARLSARSAAGYAKLGKFVRTLLRRITLIAAQNEEDGERFVALGAKNNQVTVTGSLKFDISVTPQLAAKGLDCHQHPRWRREYRYRRSPGVITSIPEFITDSGAPPSGAFPGCYQSCASGRVKLHHSFFGRSTVRQHPGRGRRYHGRINVALWHCRSRLCWWFAG